MPAFGLEIHAFNNNSDQHAMHTLSDARVGTMGGYTYPDHALTYISRSFVQNAANVRNPPNAPPPRSRINPLNEAATDLVPIPPRGRSKQAAILATEL